MQVHLWPKRIIKAETQDLCCVVLCCVRVRCLSCLFSVLCYMCLDYTLNFPKQIKDPISRKIWRGPARHPKIFWLRMAVSSRPTNCSNFWEPESLDPSLSSLSFVLEGRWPFEYPQTSLLTPADQPNFCFYQDPTRSKYCMRGSGMSEWEIPVSKNRAVRTNQGHPKKIWEVGATNVVLRCVLCVVLCCLRVLCCVLW